MISTALEIFEKSSSEPIAVIGMRGFPGGVDNPERFWVVVHGRRGIVQVPAQPVGRRRLLRNDDHTVRDISAPEGGFLTSWQQMSSMRVLLNLPREARRWTTGGDC